MFLFILKLIWIVIQALFTIVIVLFLVGVVRLLCGWRERFPNSIQNSQSLRRGDIILTGKQSALHSWYIQFANVLTRKIKHRFWTHSTIYRGEGKVWQAEQAGKAGGFHRQSSAVGSGMGPYHR